MYDTKLFKADKIESFSIRVNVQKHKIRIDYIYLEI